MIDISQFPSKVQQFYLKNKDLRPSFASSSNKGAKWIYEQSDIPWLNLGIDVPHKEMLAEAQRWIEQMVPQDYPDLFDEKGERDESPHQVGWNTICIHGLGAKQFDRGYMYGYKHEDEVPYKWTEVAENCPITKEFLESLPYEKLYRARFTMLAPGGYASPHIGRKKAANHSRKINVALNHPEGFHFVMDGQGEIPWEPGRANIIAADDYYHSVFNRSEVVRIHLITMGKPDFSKLDQLLKKSYYSDNPFGFFS